MTKPPVSRTGIEFTGEFIGTFMLVLFGCGSVCTAVLTEAQIGLFQVAIVWGLGIALAIQVTGSASGAHLNPAVTLALAAWAGFPRQKIAHYLTAQMLGAMTSALLLLALFAEPLAAFETAHHIERGTAGSEASAMILAEFYPNPGGAPLDASSWPIPTWRAMMVEMLGTAVLMMVILAVTHPKNRLASSTLAPWAIGLTITALISLFAPLTMAAFNPARDLGPRLIAWAAGWGDHVFRVNGSGWFTVYVLAPILGAQLGGWIHARLLSPSYPADTDA